MATFAIKVQRMWHRLAY